MVEAALGDPAQNDGSSDGKRQGVAAPESSRSTTYRSCWLSSGSGGLSRTIAVCLLGYGIPLKSVGARATSAFGSICKSARGLFLRLTP